MENDSKILDLENIKKGLDNLYAERKKQEEVLEEIEQADKLTELEYYGNDEDYESAKTDEEMAAEDLANINHLIYKMEDIYEKIEQCESVKKDYPEGYFRIVKSQTSKPVNDKLDRKEKADKLAKVIFKEDVKTIGVFGEWGTGKSTFLEYLKESLPKERAKVIDIKATEYSDQEKIWTYFFAKMKKSVKKDYILRFLYLLLRIRKNISKCVIPIIKICLIIMMIVVLFKFKFLSTFCVLMGVDKNVAKVFDSGINLFVAIFIVLKWIFPLSDKIVNTIEVAQSNINSLVNRKVNEKFGYKIIIKEYIDEIVEIWENYRFIFLVDELDRCNNKNIMTFLEAVQLLENYENIKIIYAIDSEIVLNAIKNSGIHNPNNYLKKYVDLKVDLESINTHDKYVKSIAKDEYKFTDKEVDEIQLALQNLEINISMRDYMHILNSLSELKERWFYEQVLTENCKIPALTEHVINWKKSIPIAIFYFAGSFWPQKIYKDFKYIKNTYIKVKYLTKGREVEYSNCPDLIKESMVIDVLNVMSFLHEIHPI